MAWDDIEDYTEEEEVGRDSKTDEAKKAVFELVSGNPDSVFYIKQLQVLLEKRFFHWITGRAVGELLAEGRLRHEYWSVRWIEGRAIFERIAEGREVEKDLNRSEGLSVRFVFGRRKRYRVRSIVKSLRVIGKYAEPEMARACGQWAEASFLVALVERGFVLFGRNTKEFQGRIWMETNHTLDFIVGREGVNYGAEVKNTWDYIPGEEFRTKMRMCKYLGVRPLFIWRYAPKTYMFEVFKAGGYGMIFKAHIFPLGHSRIVDEVRSVLGLECDSPSRIPDGIIDRFERRHGPGKGV